MAQKRNPVSLRLQTRLQGHEKRFASCWFTDLFFSQVCANDLVNRLYLGHLLQKGGNLYSEANEFPETCVSIQFLYRRCFLFSIVLDTRKEEYFLSTSVQNSGRRNLVKSQQSVSEEENIFSSFSQIKGMSRPSSQKEGHPFPTQAHGTSQGSVFSVRGQQNNVFLPDRDSLLDLYEGVYASLSSHRPRSKESILADNTIYLSIANLFVNMVVKRSYHTSFALTNQWENVLDKKRSCYYNLTPFFPHVLTIESICDLSREGVKSMTCHLSPLTRTEQGLVSLNQGRVQKTGTVQKHTAEYSLEGWALIRANTKFKTRINDPLKLSCHWTSLNLIRGVSAYQNVEFCLYSVLFLYKRRFSFLKVKELVFKMLSSNQTVRGARLVCSGRQGGRSKSAMRAKKQSALWGETALSLFSSRLAFASASVNTSFGQVGVKLWICYK